MLQDLRRLKEAEAEHALLQSQSSRQTYRARAAVRLSKSAPSASASLRQRQSSARAQQAELSYTAKRAQQAELSLRQRQAQPAELSHCWALLHSQRNLRRKIKSWGGKSTATWGGKYNLRRKILRRKIQLEEENQVAEEENKKIK